MFLVGLLIFRRREFDGIIDGIVYAGLTAAGFAFTENILYFGRAFLSVGDGRWRAVRAYPARCALPFRAPAFHRDDRHRRGHRGEQPQRRRAPVLRARRYVIAVLLHSTWNSSATLFGGGAFLIVYGLMMVPLFAAAVDDRGLATEA